MDVLTQIKKRVLHLTLNRPDKRNALTCSMCSEIIKQVRDAQQNADVGAILICANGSVFCAGMDLDEATPGAVDLDRIHEEIFTMGAWSVKPILISVNGAALGGGLGLVCQGHVVFASDKSMFGLPEVRIGLWPFFIYKAVESAIGNRRTLQASLTGHLFHPDDAMQWGLVHRVCPSVELGDRVKVMARELAKASPVAISAGLEYVQKMHGVEQADIGKIAAELRGRVMASGDFEEGVKAFKQKREPRWPSLPSSFYESD